MVALRKVATLFENWVVGEVTSRLLSSLPGRASGAMTASRSQLWSVRKEGGEYLA